MRKERVFLDVTFLARWLGPPVGMARVEAELARHAGDRFVPVVYDGRLAAYRPLRRNARDAILGPREALDPTVIAPRPESRLKRTLLPSRLPALMALERARLAAPPFLSSKIDRLQRGLLAVRRSDFPMLAPDGTRFNYRSAGAVLEAPLVLGPSDRVLASVADWSGRDIGGFTAMIAAAKARFVPICYDLIPITHPQFYRPDDAQRFAAVWSALLPVSPRVVVNSRSVADDVAAWSSRLGLAPPELFIRLLGVNRPKERSETPLPGNLTDGNYALYVSTIEPRKNHRLLIDIWRRLVARGWPQARRFTLVFVGRPGWLVDDILADLARPTDFAGTLLHLDGVEDETLAQLMSGAAFCLYPSFKEGFGLPVLEAFAHGKAVIASTGGSLPEVISDLSPVLDPGDARAWERRIVDWVDHPESRAPFEAAIRARFADPLAAPLDWAGAAAGIMDVA